MGKSFSAVYKIVNLNNKKLYVGSACDVLRRKEEHFRMLRGGYHNNTYLQRSWNKYGGKKFRFVILEKCPTEKLIEVEQKWIDTYESYKFKNGYNRSRVAGSMLGYRHSDAAKKRMSASQTGRTHSEESKEKIRQAHLGVPKTQEHRNNIWRNRQGWRHSEETKKRISESLKVAVKEGRIPGPLGWKHSEEARAKISATHKGKPKSAEQRAKMSAAHKRRFQDVQGG